MSSMSMNLPALKRPTTPQASTALTARGGLLQRKCACGGAVGSDDKCEDCRQKGQSVQRLASGKGGPALAPPIVHDVLRSPGQPLDVPTRAFMEPRFGHDFSKVRIHTDAKAAQSARSVRAQAYTVGQNVVFDSGYFAPSSRSGRWLLAHELTHVVQQSTSPRTDVLTVGDDRSQQEVEANSLASVVVQAGATRSLPMSRPQEVARLVPEAEVETEAETESEALPVPGPGQRYAPNLSHLGLEALLELARRANSVEDAQTMLETPVASLARVGSPPDFITMDPVKRQGTVGNKPDLTIDVDVDPTPGNIVVTFQPYYLDILGVIEYEVGKASSIEDLKRIREDYLPALFTRRRDFIIPPDVDPTGEVRVEVFAKAAEKRATQVVGLDPTLVLPEKIPQDSAKRGCRMSVGRGFLDPRFTKPAFSNWAAAVFCQQATDSLHEYRFTVPDGTNFAIFDGKHGDVVYECKCGYDSIPKDLASDDPAKQARGADRLYQKIIRQKDNHLVVANACGLRLRYMVNNADLAQILEGLWGGNPSVQHVDFPIDGCAP